MKLNLSCKKIALILGFLCLITGFTSFIKAGGEVAGLSASVFGIENNNKKNEELIFLTTKNIDDFLAEPTEDQINNSKTLFIKEPDLSEIEF